MLINIAEPERHPVTDYDFTLSNGFLLQITIDETKGDTVELGDQVTKIHLSEKKSKLNPKDVLSAEDIIVFTPHILVINKKVRLEADVTPEQQSAWLDTVKEVSKTVH